MVMIMAKILRKYLVAVKVQSYQHLMSKTNYALFRVVISPTKSVVRLEL